MKSKVLFLPYCRRNGFYPTSFLRVSVILVFLTIQISVSGFSQVTNLSISLKGASIVDLLEEIKLKADYDYFFVEEVVNQGHKVNLNLQDASIEDIMGIALKGSGLAFEIIDKVIVIMTLPVELMEVPVYGVNVDLPPQRIITGKVISSEDGSEIPGASVQLKGTLIGTGTDTDGTFSLQVPDDNAVLVISFLGFEPQEVIVGSRTSINITLKLLVSEVGEVIVTAIGTQMNSDQTGSTSSSVNVSGVVRSGEAGVINAMAGKASGVRIGKSNGDPGAGSSIQIRGSNTITGGSQPLVILDGMPVSNDNIGGVTVSQQSRLDDISSSDIESIQVYKGASAAAVWGSRAANGVIVITTKSGEYGKRPEVQYSFTQSFDKVSVRYNLQSDYGQGRMGVYNQSFGESWGDKISERSGAADVVDMLGAYFLATDGTRYSRIITKNSSETFNDSNWDQVFRLGSYSNHNVSVSGGGQKGSYFFSFDNLNQDGTIRNFDYNRKSIRLNTKTQVADWLVWSNRVAYTKTSSERIVQAGETTNGVLLALLRTSPDFDVTDYIGSYVAANGTVYPNRQRTYRSQYGQVAGPVYNNPLWTIYEQKAPSDVNRFIINPELTINAMDWLKFILRGGLDYYSDNRSEFYPINSSSALRRDGRWIQTGITSMEMTADFLAIASRDITEDINVRATLGVSYNDKQRYTNTNTISPFAVDSRLMTSDLNPDNGSTAWNTNKILVRSNRGFGVLNFGLFNQFFVNLTGALEAASTIKGSFFYPSADLAWQFGDLITSDILSFGKLRFAWGKVGIQPAPYKFETLAATGFDTFGGSFIVSNEKGNPNLRPEVKTEWELGTDIRLFNDWISVGITYYDNRTDDILFGVKTNPSSGYNFVYKNAASIENKGFEIDLKGQLIRRENFNVSVIANFNNNRNLVVDIAGAETVDIGGTSKAVKGYPMSSFYLPGTLRDSDGNFVLNANGFPQLDTKYRVLGDPNPDWRGGLGLDLSWKGVDFSFLFERSQGGEYIDRTRVVLYGFGMHQDVSHEITLSEGLTNVNGTVYPAGSVVRGNVHDFGAGEVLLDELWYRGIGGGLGFNKGNDLFVEDATWTKLRNITLGYNLSKMEFISRAGISNLRFSVTGRDLFLWTKLRDVDPETNNYGVSNASGMNYFTNPGSKSVLFNLQVTF